MVHGSFDRLDNQLTQSNQCVSYGLCRKEINWTTKFGERMHLGTVCTINGARQLYFVRPLSMLHKQATRNSQTVFVGRQLGRIRRAITCWIETSFPNCLFLSGCAHKVVLQKVRSLGMNIAGWIFLHRAILHPETLLPSMVLIGKWNDSVVK